MDLRILLALAVLGLLIWIGSGVHRGPTPPPSAAPTITSIEFPEQIQADGQEVLGSVGFQDPDGDIIEVRFEVVQAILFEPFHFDPEAKGQRKGQFDFAVYTVIPQDIILRVALVDQAGHESPPVEFSFKALESLGNSP
ncbi:MAG: hypothetical protein A2Z21_07490 [Candidatus Fraserbacteria bacterium RBG_16_55_9]|uniref:Bacterial spore germination immunoglobulin-like domain-containing protein n=1 Tax=Fraserbacteria sp. (strain RBG_16_55_9) TaxID=1817864 RepID=A0A1F5UT76_FRAXR|nr:MAG: hypothetical protein A2Z21_07490 [Candidatus Fraserbacteria bacterium RBG_16_55_9]